MDKLAFFTMTGINNNYDLHRFNSYALDLLR